MIITPIFRQLFCKLLWCFLSCLSSIKVVFFPCSFAQIIISFAGKQASIRLTLLCVLLVLILILLTRVASAGKYFIIHYTGTETPHFISLLYSHCFIVLIKIFALHILTSYTKSPPLKLISFVTKSKYFCLQHHKKPTKQELFGERKQLSFHDQSNIFL